MNTLRISAVSYLNTIPFVYGILESGFLRDFRLELDVPSVCSRKLLAGEVDIALVPVGAIPDFDHYHLIDGYCIGAVSRVRTVLLLSHVPLEKISKIHLDWDSRTSVKLVQVLAKKFWHIHPEWIPLQSGDAEQPGVTESLVAIGDKTFELASRFEYIYDLAEEWIRFTSLPFVFAVWMSKEPLPEDILHSFNKALEFGVNHKKETIQFFSSKIQPGIDPYGYLSNNISFIFDDAKKKGLKLFLSLIK
ncbi:MAG: menaquinone biosynthesis protein [Bacteroidetes bacterium]|nr:menaquinone biosynthesis protein [Bacteroidota bacterium]